MPITYAVVVDWYGPYESVKAAKAATRDWGGGEIIYVAMGTVARQRIPKLQYVGITRNFEGRLSPNHKIRTTLKEEGLSLYLGQVGSQAVAGRKAKHQHKGFTALLYLAESAMAFFLQLPLNSDKRCSPPNDPVILVNRWWKTTDYDARKRKRPPNWPDFIEYDNISQTGSVVWHGGKREHFSAELIKETCARASAELKAARARETA